MTGGSFRWGIAAMSLLLAASPPAVRGDEGMWTYDNVPADKLERTYGFRPSADWLNHLMKSTVRFNSGGSGSFVSADGLVLTNQHVAADTIAKLSTAERDYVRDGYLATTHAQELRALDLELNVLQKIEDVTTAVTSAVKAEMTGEEKALARRAAIEQLEREGSDRSGLRANVVTLYQGGLYHLYYYKRYTDVRLVFAPEKAIAYFGGDPDNFEYPRYCLDMTLFRAYENGKPAQVEHFLRWSESGPADGQLTFVTGHPGRTSRLNTLASLQYQAELAVPYNLDRMRRLERSLEEFSRKSPESARRADKELTGVQNGRKILVGRDKGLREGTVLKEKAREEAELRARIAGDPALKQYAGAWETIQRTRARARTLHLENALFESAHSVNSPLFAIARHLVRMAEEDAKPSSERLPEYQDARREELLLGLYSDAPIYLDLEEWKLAESLRFFSEKAASDGFKRDVVLAGKSPEARAAELIRGTRLSKVAERRVVASGGKEAIAASTDTMILLAKALDADARHVRRLLENEVDEPEKQAYQQISSALFALHGTSLYPDATFTPRLAFGPVRGYAEGDRDISWRTTLGGAFLHEKKHQAKEPWKLPASWHKAHAAGKIRQELPFNFVSTADIIGGNSGSPVVNKDAELVGLIFDSNIHGLLSDYRYDDEKARAVSVASSGMLEALRSVYGADELVKELTAP